MCVQGDAMNPEQVQAAFDQIEEVDAVVTTIGGTPADASADSEGNINLIKVSAAGFLHAKIDQSIKG